MIIIKVNEREDLNMNGNLNQWKLTTCIMANSKIKKRRDKKLKLDYFYKSSFFYLKKKRDKERGGLTGLARLGGVFLFHVHMEEFSSHSAGRMFVYIT